MALTIPPTQPKLYILPLAVSVLRLCRLWCTPGNLALFSPEGGDNERRGENHLVLQKSMLLTAGLKGRENSLADCGEPEGGKEWEVGSRVYVMRMRRHPE